MFKNPGRQRVFNVQAVDDAVKWAEDCHELKDSKCVKQICDKLESDIMKDAVSKNNAEPTPSVMTKWRAKKVSFHTSCQHI